MYASDLVRRLARDRSGASAVETALVLPIFLVLVIGLLLFAWTLHCAASVRFALEEAARTLPLDPSIDQAKLQSMVQSRLGGLGDSNVTVELTRDSPSAGLTMAHASATYRFAVGAPLLPAFTGTFVAHTDVPISAS